MPKSNQYISNPEDYVDAIGYKTLPQTLAKSDGAGRRAPPPPLMAKSIVMDLPTMAIATEKKASVCAICKDMVNVGELAKKLPCGQKYPGDCIVPWLGSKNYCPICRFELPTNDPKWEVERKNKAISSPRASSLCG